jgi:hypothetical protein
VVEGFRDASARPPSAEVLVTDLDAARAPLVSGSGRVQEDGSFEVRASVSRAILRVRGTNGLLLKSVRARGLDVTDEGLDLLHDLSDVEIVLTAQPAHLEGVVADAAGRARPFMDVVVFPTDRKRWALVQNRFVATAKTDPAGKFKMAPLPSGEYLVTPVEKLVLSEWTDPDNLARLEALAMRIRLNEGETRTLSLTVPR